jgi:GNAT superfamily N-acetyltransferase
MLDSYRVVPAASGHVSVLSSIERSAAERFRDEVPAELLEHVTDEATFLDSQQRATLWVALGSDDEPVGFACVIVAGACVHLAELDVLPSHGRRGIGTALVREVESWARLRHSEAITLTTYSDLPWNAPFYAGLGFTVIPEGEWDLDMRRRFEAEAGLPSERARRVVMRKPLDTT